MLHLRTKDKSLAGKIVGRFVKSKAEKNKQALLESKYLSALTKPVAVTAITASAYAATTLVDAPKTQKFLKRAALSAALAGGANAILKRLIGKKRPRAIRGPDFKGPTLKDKFNAMPSGHAAAMAAVAGSIPKSSGPLVLASAAGYAATALIGKSRTDRDAHYKSDVMVGSCLGFAAAYLVSKVSSPAPPYKK
ncbi:phosphatase PAP2 family protein [Salinimonas lutimaris]|uniref:phosphatase PAP2 family protein n=1 Tax=Salinimonas lutimaris TaxID=914153 RepID=UPI0010C105DA|nr:phosphatase PAP2 family protein [Salinimonas lutimaris]